MAHVTWIWMIGILKWYLLPSNIATKGKTNLKQLPANLLGQELMRFPNVWSTDVSEAITFESKQPLWDVLLSCISWPLTRKGQTWGEIYLIGALKNKQQSLGLLININTLRFLSMQQQHPRVLWHLDLLSPALCNHYQPCPRSGQVVRAIASRTRGPGSIPGPTRIIFLS